MLKSDVVLSYYFTSQPPSQLSNHYRNYKLFLRPVYVYNESLKIKLTDILISTWMMHHLLNIISYFMCKSSKPTYKGVDILMISFGVFVSDS